MIQSEIKKIIGWNKDRRDSAPFGVCFSYYVHRIMKRGD